MALTSTRSPERPPREKPILQTASLPAAMRGPSGPPVSSMLYRDGTLLREALDAAAARQAEHHPQARRAAPSARRRGPARRASTRPLLHPFETGDLDARRFENRVSAPEARLNDLRDQDAALAEQLAPQAHTTPNRADLAASLPGSRT